MKEAEQRLLLDRGEAGVVVDYLAERPLKLRQWTGYDPNATYFLWGGPLGPQAHPLVGFLGPRRMAGQGAGCGSGDPPHRAGSVQKTAAKDFAVIRRDGREWKLSAPEF